MDNLQEPLKAAGYRIVPTDVSDTGCSWYAYKYPDTTCHCACNKKPPVITVKPWYISCKGYTNCSAVVELVADVGDQWFEMSAYAINPDELMGRLPRIEKSLQAAWESAYAVNSCDHA